MENLSIRTVTTPLGTTFNGYVMINETLTLCNVKFHSINTESGEITYLVTPTGDNKGQLMTNIHVFESVDNFKKGIAYGKTISLIPFVRYLINIFGIPAEVFTSSNSDIYFLNSYKFENGNVEQVKNYFPTIYGTKEENLQEFEGLYKTREEAFAWNDIKVSENGTETIKEGILKALSLTDEQKALVEEFMAMKNKLNENNIQIIYDNDECSMSFLNTSKYDLECAYNKEELHDKDTESYEEVSELLYNPLKNICSKNPTYDIYDFYDGKYFVRKK